jgi:hypothetical protein
MTGALTDESIAKQKEIQLKMENLLEQEELYCVQRGRVNWLCHGDQNTAFFHRSATARRKRNFIKEFKNANGDTIDDQDQLLLMASEYFDNLFTSEVQFPLQHVLDTVKPCVSQVMNDILMAPYTREEVKRSYV